MIGFLVGVAVGCAIASRYGMAKARAMRAWSDWVVTKNSMVGLAKRTVAETWTAVKYAALGVAVAVIAILVIFVR